MMVTLPCAQLSNVHCSAENAPAAGRNTKMWLWLASPVMWTVCEIWTLSNCAALKIAVVKKAAVAKSISVVSLSGGSPSE